ncbi:MAG: DUF1361 domain-containing protein [Agriterribacter sp.]
MKHTLVVKRIMYMSLSFTLLMIAARIIYTRQWYGLFLVWNLFLAWVPFILSTLLYKKRDAGKWIPYLIFAAWLLFFPNAPYIITDFLHLQVRPPVPIWYDIVILFWASWNGLLLGFISLLYVEQFLLTKFKLTLVNKMVYICMVLCGFGVYAGRYLRWNSWDVFINPGEIWGDVKYIALNPEDNLRTWGVTFSFSLLMITCYLTIKNLRKAFP